MGKRIRTPYWQVWNLLSVQTELVFPIYPSAAERRIADGREVIIETPTLITGRHFGSGSRIRTGDFQLMKLVP